MLFPSLFAMGDDGALMCVLSKSFLWDWIKESLAFRRFFGPKERNLLYYIASVAKEMEKLDGF
jgi:hypothetical protein